MHGSIRKGYGGGKDISAEYNVKRDAAAAQTCPFGRLAARSRSPRWTPAGW